MGRFTKMLVGGMAAALLAAGSASADFLLSDFDDGTNVSKMGTYYYLYSACSPISLGSCRKDDIPAFDPTTTGPADEYGPVSYKAVAGGAGGAGYCAVLKVDVPAHKGSVDTSDIYLKGEYYPGFGLGILLSDGDDVGLDISNVTAVEFKAKTESAGVVVGFKIETTDNSPSGPYGNQPGGGKTSDPWDDASNAYFTTFEPTKDWATYKVELKPVVASTIVGTALVNEKGKVSGSVGAKPYLMEQEGYWGYSFTFDPKKATKIAWFINANKGTNGGGVRDVWIDDVKFLGTFTYTAPDICVDCDKTTFTIPTPNKKLSDFEDSDPLLNERSYYWFYYDDTKGDGDAHGNSSVSGLITNPFIEGEYIMDTEGNGREGGAGAHIEFTMGPAYSNGKATVEPFVGIGANVYDDDNGVDYLNASAFKGIYFEYATSANVEYIDVEVSDMLDAAGKAADKDGEVYYTRIKGSSKDGEWKSATVPFDKLVLPTWVKTSGERRKGADGSLIPLDKSRLAQLKFKQRGNPGLDGVLSIDNVYFYGADKWGEGVGVKHIGSKSKVRASDLRATYSRGVVGVNWNTVSSVASGKIQLVNTKGRVVASAPIVGASGKVTAKLSAGTMPTGMYFVRVNAKDVNGKKIVSQAPVSIVK